MQRLKLLIIGVFAAVFLAAAGVYACYVAGMLRKAEFLLLCSQGEIPNIPKPVCQAFLSHVGLSSDDVASINRDVGVLWAVLAEDERDRSMLLAVLLKYGVDINAVNLRNGLRPLHGLVLHNHPEALDLLLKNGADPGLRDAKKGKTPLEFAIELQARQGAEDRTEIIRLLQRATSAQP